MDVHHGKAGAGPGERPTRGFPAPPEHEVDLGGLLIGTASAALQIEGGDRGNDWVRWAAAPGTIADGSTPLRATDHWRRWRQDNALMADLGLRAARIGLEWSRIQPAPGRVDHAALDRYREEIGDLVDRGIAPLVTLHHFVNPIWFADRGGFTAAGSAAAFADYARVAVGSLGDLVTDWVTVNEPNVYATAAHLFDEAPPARRSWRATLRVLRNMAIAHVRGYRLIHELQGGAARVGIAHHARAFTPRDPANPVHRATVPVARHLFQGIIAEAALAGRFHPLLGGNRGTGVTPGRYYDYLGLNYYSRTAVAGLRDGTLPGVPVNDLGWEVHPAGLVDCAAELVARYDAPVWVTENGTADAGDPAAGVAERFRRRFILDHLLAIAGSGLPIERYYHWCFVDNWEWQLGEGPRFGIVALDYETQRRRPRPSARLLGELAATGRITPDLYRRHTAGQAYPMAPPAPPRRIRVPGWCR